MIKDIFSTTTTAELLGRIGQLQPTTTALWGKMSVDQMLAHCSVTYEMVYEDRHPKPSGFKKMLLKMLVKNLVVSEKPYKQNSHTAPQFIISDRKNFEQEQQRLSAYITQTQELGGDYFDGKESNSFGPLSRKEWNNMFYKHLDHHLKQFGV